MPVDLSVFEKVRMKKDYDRAEEEFQLKKLQSKGSSPAALQIADAYAQARAAGDVQRMNDIAIAAKSFDRGVVYDANGNPVAMGGYGSAVGEIEGAKSGAKQQAQKSVDLNMNPQISYAEERAKSKAGTAGELNERIASLPQLEQTVDTLSALGKNATYTGAGRVLDTIIKEAGMKPRASAVARTEYESLVDNQVLPLLRQTFGAQFTQKEGESLKKTLGDPNKTPEEKDAVLRSFIDQKKQTINSMQRQLGVDVTQFPPMSMEDLNGSFPGGRTEPPPAPMTPSAMPEKGQVMDGYVYLGGDPAKQSSWKKAR